ncbi:hypothetical protein [Massilia sp. YIM B04103]|uniref:hypothetical protein n=1 Tax=Massilia sp. YIM B04103 TaxID=2963106 RepID=UPI002108749C|nr:hypothetical protein [Massilia sp. YIM B04103]
MNKLNGIAKENIPQPTPTAQAEVELRPVNNSDLPILANFAAVQAVPGLVCVDFGFLDFQALHSLTRLAEGDASGRASIRGRLTCRVALSGDAVASLARQLNQLLPPRLHEQLDQQRRQEGIDTVAKEPSLQ